MDYHESDAEFFHGEMTEAREQRDEARSELAALRDALTQLADGWQKRYTHPGPMTQPLRDLYDVIHATDPEER